MNMKLGEIPRRIDSDFKTRKANLINPGVRGAQKIGEKKSYSPIKYFEFENAARGPAVRSSYDERKQTAQRKRPLTVWDLPDFSFLSGFAFWNFASAVVRSADLETSLPPTCKLGKSRSTVIFKIGNSETCVLIHNYYGP